MIMDFCGIFYFYQPRIIAIPQQHNCSIKFLKTLTLSPISGVSGDKNALFFQDI